MYKVTVGLFSDVPSLYLKKHEAEKQEIMFITFRLGKK